MSEAKTEIVEKLIDPSKQHLLKVILLGDECVGKTSIFKVYMKQQFTPDYITTVGVDYGAKETCFQGENIKFQVWDTAGQERFRSVTKAYIRGASAIIAVYDITKQKSLDMVVQMLKEYNVAAAEESSKTIIVLVGNKIDQEEHRQVTKEDGQKLADQLGANFIECSALSNTNIAEIFGFVQKEHLIKLGRKILWWKK